MTISPAKLSRLEWLVLLAILLTACFLRFYHLDTVPPGLHADEAVDGNDAWLTWQSGHGRVFYPENHGREGLLINLQALAFGLAGGRTVAALRWPGACLGTLTVWGVLMLARQIISNGAALMAAFLCGISFWQIDISRFGTRLVGATFFLVWTLVFLFVAIRRSQSGDYRWWRWAVGCGVVYGLGFYTYTAYRITPILVLMVLGISMFDCPWRSLRKTAAVVISVASVVVLPLGIYAWRHPEEFSARIHALPGLDQASPVRNLVLNVGQTIGLLFHGGDPNPLHEIPGQSLLGWPVGLLLAIGLVLTIQRQRWLIGWLFIGIVPAVVVNEGTPHAWRCLLAAPAVYLIAGIGGWWLFEQARRLIAPPVIQGITLISALLLVAAAYHSYFSVWAHDARTLEATDQSLREIANQLNTLPRDLPKYVVLEPDLVTVRGLPWAAQTIMFLTDTSSPENQRLKNIHYLWLSQTNEIALGRVYVSVIPGVHP